MATVKVEMRHIIIVKKCIYWPDLLFTKFVLEPGRVAIDNQAWRLEFGKSQSLQVKREGYLRDVNKWSQWEIQEGHPHLKQPRDLLKELSILKPEGRSTVKICPQSGILSPRADQIQGDVRRHPSWPKHWESDKPGTGIYDKKTRGGELNYHFWQSIFPPKTQGDLPIAGCVKGWGGGCPQSLERWKGLESSL